MILNPNLPDFLQDFREYQKLTWRWMGWPDPDPIAANMAYEIQHGPERMVVVCYRAGTKTATQIAFSEFCHLHNPESKQLFVSASSRFAANLSRWRWQRLRTHPALLHLCPSQKQLDSVVQFDLFGIQSAKDPSVASVGVESQSTGRRPDKIFLDDVETEKNTETVKLREKLDERIIEYDNLLPDAEDARLLVCGTYQSEDSIYTTLEKRGFVVFQWPQRFPTKEYFQMIKPTLAPALRRQCETDPSVMEGGGIDGTLGQPTNPERFPELKCREKEVAVGRRKYRLHYLLDPRVTSETRYPLKLRDLVVMDLGPEVAPMNILHSNAEANILADLHADGFRGDRFYGPALVSDLRPFTAKGLFIDPAGRGSDQFRYAVVGALNALIFVLETRGFMIQHTPEAEVYQQIADAAVRWKVNFCRIEDNFGDGAVGKLMVPVVQQAARSAGLTIGVENETTKRNKQWRITEYLEHTASTHRLIVNRAVILSDINDRVPGLSEEDQRQYRFCYQYSHFQREKDCGLEHDDAIDVVTMGVDYFTNQLALNQARGIEDANQRERIQKYHEDVRRFGGPRPPSSSLDFSRLGSLRSAYSQIDHPKPNVPYPTSATSPRPSENGGVHQTRRSAFFRSLFSSR